MSLLKIENLSISYRESKKIVNAVKNLSLSIENGEIFCVIGESGSGKSTLAMCILGLLEKRKTTIKGSIIFDNKELLMLEDKEYLGIRGKSISAVLSDPQEALNPVLNIEKQISEVLILHNKMSKSEANKQVPLLLKEAGIHNPNDVAKCFPHQLSGGMCQRVLIAMAMCTNPRLIIADEPTRGLDLATSKKILDLIKEQVFKYNTSIMLITHDLYFAREYADRVAVICNGELVEEGSSEDIFGDRNNRNDYTIKLLEAMDFLDGSLSNNKSYIEN